MLRPSTTFHWALALFATMILPAAAQAPLRVACIGDSITYGDQLPDRAVQSYPAVLERLAGGRFAVRNFGVNATTALPGTGRAWTGTPACRDALAFAPDLVVVMLGINDLAFPGRHGEYPAGLRDILRRFQTLPSAPRVFLCTLTPIAPAEAQAPANQTIRDTLNPAIRAVAAETGAQVIDISAAFPNREELLPDGLHPAPAGAEIIARAVLAALDAPAAPPPQIRPAPVAGPVDVSIRHEARAAQHRAELWLKTQARPGNLPPPLSSFTSQKPGTSSDLLPLLTGAPCAPNHNLFFAYAALAARLDREGNETVFLPDGRPVAWREALLHQIVQRQKIDGRGGGFWQDPATADDAADAPRSTAYALQAIAAALGE